MRRITTTPSATAIQGETPLQLLSVLDLLPLLCVEIKSSNTIYVTGFGKSSVWNIF